MSTPAELLAELQAAHTIIRNALAVMTTAQKLEWGTRNARDGVDGEGITRAHERMALIGRASTDTPAPITSPLHSVLAVPESGGVRMVQVIDGPAITLTLDATMARSLARLLTDAADQVEPTADHSATDTPAGDAPAAQDLLDALASARAELLTHQAIELRDALASVQAELRAHQVRTLVADALRSGALLPTLTAWATSIGMKDINALRGFLEPAHQIAPDPAPQIPGGTLHTTTEQERAQP